MPAHPPFEVRPPIEGETVFRLLNGDLPHRNDFFSDEADGRNNVLMLTKSVAISRGFSTRNTLTQARRLGRLLGKTHIAEVRLDEEEGDGIAHTFGRGHRTIWAEPEMFERVIEVHTVDEYA